MLVEAAVFGGEKSFDEIGRQFAERHDGRHCAAAAADFIAFRIEYCERERGGGPCLHVVAQARQRDEDKQQSRKNGSGQSEADKPQPERMAAAHTARCGVCLFRRRVVGIGLVDI